MQIARNITQLIGHTPLVHLNRIPQAEGCVGRILVKLEGINPAAEGVTRELERLLDNKHSS